MCLRIYQSSVLVTTSEPRPMSQSLEFSLNQFQSRKTVIVTNGKMNTRELDKRCSTNSSKKMTPSNLRKCTQTSNLLNNHMSSSWRQLVPESFQSITLEISTNSSIFWKALTVFIFQEIPNHLCKVKTETSSTQSERSWSGLKSITSKNQITSQFSELDMVS